MPESAASTYDALQYDDLVFAATHPGTLATVAALHGLDAPPLDRCRVLELGCAAGANLMPMALAFPASQFVGLDLSPKQIDRGKEIVSQLAIANLELQARDILESTNDLGMFDYIIAHGVYSWVPPPVQNRMLDLIQGQLKPQGFAYISYNVYPGWHMREMVRDVLTFHANSGDPATRTAQARGLLAFLYEHLPAQESVYATILRSEAETLREEADSYLFHEHLETDNRPVYFHEFAGRAAAHGLQYLAEASPQPLAGHLKPDTIAHLAEMAEDRIRLEQYLDFLRGRAFRRSVLCHESARPEWNGIADRIPKLAISSEARPESAAPDSDGRETFLTPNKVRFTTNDPSLQLALRRLWDARPAALPFNELCAVVQQNCPDQVEIDQRLAQGLLQLYLGSIVELHRDRPALAASPGTRPNTSSLIRLQAAQGRAKLHDLRNRISSPDPFARYLLTFLDGRRDRNDLVGLLAQRSVAGEFEVRDSQGQAVTHPQQMRELLASWIDRALDLLAKSGLLTA